jgi:Zn-dependent hydrolases, including glyoxylases
MAHASLPGGPRPDVQGFYDEVTGSVQYVVSDPRTRCCAIIDPVLDFDHAAGSVATRSADAILAYIGDQGLRPVWILETHPHADHFSAAHYLKEKTGTPTAIGARIVEVQAVWKAVYGMDELPADGSQWDRLVDDGDQLEVGDLRVRVMACPGHTPASVTYVAGDAAFIHDTLFMPDSGSARADFPGGCATQLWHSIQAILALPDATRLFTGHDYRANGREPRWESTVGEQRRSNIHVAGYDHDRYVAMRRERDASLRPPTLMLLALQVNIQGGRLPDPQADGRRYLTFPLDAFARLHTPTSPG